MMLAANCRKDAAILTTCAPLHSTEANLIVRFLATAMVKLKGMRRPCRGCCVTRTSGRLMQLYAQSDMESMRDAQGKFLEQLLGDRMHPLTEKVQ